MTINQTRFRGWTALLLAVVLTVLLPLASVRLEAQATLTSTTTSAAVGDTVDRFSVASATGITVGTRVYIDKELMEVLEVIGTATLRVRRGINGTSAAAHASGAVVYAGAAGLFGSSDPAGPCTATNEIALPRINVTTGNVYQCQVGFWRVYRQNGIRAFSSESLGNGGTDYTASGAITVEPGVVFLNAGSALAMTLAAPSTDQNGLTMCIISKTAQAHTVTNTAGFGGGTTARDVATYTAAINNGFCIVASGGVWYPYAMTNITFA